MFEENLEKLSVFNDFEFYLYKEGKIYNYRFSTKIYEIFEKDQRCFRFWGKILKPLSKRNNKSICIDIVDFPNIIQNYSADDISILIGRNLWNYMDKDSFEILVSYNDIENVLKNSVVPDIKIKQAILEYVNARHSMMMAPLTVYEIICSVQYDYENVAQVVKVLANESVLSTDKSFNNISIHGFLKSNVRTGENFEKIFLQNRLNAPAALPFNYSDIIKKFPELSLDKCKEYLEKAANDIENDPSSAMGISCSYLESIAKRILELSATAVPNDKSITALIRACGKALALSPDSTADSDLKSINNSIANIASKIGSIRTRYSHAHGKGLKDKELGVRHARYIVNLAYSLSYFLIETFYETYKKKNPS